MRAASGVQKSCPFSAISAKMPANSLLREAINLKPQENRQSKFFGVYYDAAQMLPAFLAHIPMQEKSATLLRCLSLASASKIKLFWDMLLAQARSALALES
jgi:hypothetical protein